MAARRLITRICSTAVSVASALALGAGVVAVPATAAAGVNVITTRIQDGRLVIEGTDDLRGETVYVQLESGPQWRISASSDNPLLALSAGAGCANNAYNSATICPASLALSGIDVYLYGGPDRTVVGMTVTGYPALVPLRLPMRIFGGTGRDDLRGGPLDDELYGGTGNDDIMGDQGSDKLFGEIGDDNLTGDTRTLLTLADLAADEFSGGAGIDTVVEERNLGVTQYWSLDGVANDGADLDDDTTNGPDEGDNVLIDVENLTLGADNDIVVGSAVANKIVAYIGDDVVRSLGGDDDVNVYFTGRNYVDAGPGDDRVFGSGTLLGGTGDDDIEGSGGSDTITPGPGLDSVVALGNNDTINAADGQRDLVNCGIGTDVATTDASDVLSTGLEVCEYVMGPVAAPVLAATLGTMRITAPGAGTLVVTITTPVTTLGRTAAVVLGTKTITTAGLARLSVSVPWTTAGRARATGASMATTVKLRFTKRGTTSPWATTTRAVTFRK